MWSIRLPAYQADARTPPPRPPPRPPGAGESSEGELCTAIEVLCQCVGTF